MPETRHGQLLFNNNFICSFFFLEVVVETELEVATVNTEVEA